MLGAIAQKQQHTAVKWREGDQDGQHPPTREQGLNDDQRVTDKQHARPGEQLAAPCRFVLWEEDALPIVFQSAAANTNQLQWWEAYQDNVPVAMITPR